MDNINDFSLDQLEQAYHAVMEKVEAVDFHTFLKNPKLLKLIR